MKTLLFLLLSLSVFANPASNVRHHYNYYYDEPFFASLTAVLMQPMRAQPTALVMQPLEGRNQIFLFENRANIIIYSYIQDKPAPLIYLLPGLGGGANNGTALFVAEKLYLQGYSVIVVPSPFNWQFILAQSQSALPGYPERDAIDLINFMVKIKEQLETEHMLKATRSSIMGFSMGAHYAAFVMQQERMKPVLDISKAVLINPPIDLSYAAETIDSLYEIGNNWSYEYKEQIWGYLINRGIDLLTMNSKKGGGIPFLGLDKVFHLSVNQIKYIIGDTFRNTLREVIFTSHQVKNYSLLKQPISKYKRNARFDEAKKFSFQNYLNFVASTVQIENRKNKLSEQNIIQRSNFNSLLNQVAKDPAYRMMHNLDDFLIKSEDLLHLSGAMKDRAIVYPKGGHIGNLWNEDNFKDILYLLEN